MKNVVPNASHPKPTFKVGDRVVNTEKEQAQMGRWEAIIWRACPAPKVNTPDGWCYETLGVWTSKGGFDRKLSKRPALRQLWANHLQSDSNPTIALEPYLEVVVPSVPANRRFNFAQ